MMFSLVACGEETALPTELDSAEVTADVDLTEAAFETAPTQSLAELGYSIDQALIGFGGLPTVFSSVVAAGPAPKRLPRVVERVDAFGAGGTASAIPAAVLGKTLVWNITTDEYELSNPALTGAPAAGVRFHLYQVDAVTGLPAEPLVQVGYADLSREGTTNSPAARLAIFTVGGTKVLEYVATVGGTQNVPSFRVEGSAGTGPNAATFTLTVGVNLTNGTVTAVWRTVIPARGLTSRTTLGIGQNSFTITGVMQRGLSKVEINGTLSFATGGNLTVKVGNRVFAQMTTDLEGGTTVTNADGEPLTPEQEATLEAIFDWFDSARSWYSALLDPIYTVLDVPLD